MNFRKNIKKLIVILLILALLPSVTAKAEIAAPTYTMKEVQETLTGDKGDTLATISYEKLVLDGNSENIQKINRSINYDCKKFFQKDKENLFSYAQMDYDIYPTRDFGYYSTCVCQVTYNKNDILSLKLTWSWYAGGVKNSSSYGLTYDLKTGKRLGLTDVAEGTPTQIKNKIITATKKYLNNLDDTSFSTEEINSALANVKKVKLSDYRFYLKGNWACICFDEYELIGNYYGGNIVSIKSKVS